MRNLLFSVVGAVVLGLSSIASAQVTNTSQGTAGGPAPPTNVDITLKGVVESSVQLRIDGALLTLESSLNAPAISTATVDFGTFSTANPTLANADVANRSTAGTPGAFVAVKLQASLIYSGAATGNIVLERAANAGAAPDVPTGNLRYGGSTQTWNDVSADGTTIADPGIAPIDVCGGVCVNTQQYAHQLAVFIPDTQAAGPFTTVVRYTGTAP